MEWLQSHRNTLWAVTIILAGIQAAILVYAKLGNIPTPLSRWEFGLITLPSTLLLLSFLPLVYLAWFGKPRSPYDHSILRFFYWLITAVVVLGIGGIYYLFVF
ncbi:MAG: hypothetical protein WBO06_10075 [Gammaproteobacteria bacterium]